MDVKICGRMIGTASSRVVFEDEDDDLWAVYYDFRPAGLDFPIGPGTLYVDFEDGTMWIEGEGTFDIVEVVRGP